MTEQAVGAVKVFVHLPLLVGRGREAARDHDFFFLAQTAHALDFSINFFPIL